MPIRLLRLALPLGLATLPLAGCYVGPAGVVRPAPVYVRPAPVYVRPPPVYVRPPPPAVVSTPPIRLLTRAAIEAGVRVRGARALAPRGPNAAQPDLRTITGTDLAAGTLLPSA